ncbi:HD domain-containing protein [Alteromonas sp. ASW11-130]|uniref:HD domain-containing protein n=1 Tax=Alteromonas sp. ASW11-130 TaxID=3015775 RepID=UPI00224259EC|nr:HD domain-containing protein [Alteromonas sp. ASW11-130]MCW8091413.1 HD domain-containing protein [Alteromonas sp. ASW11-130]
MQKLEAQLTFINELDLLKGVQRQALIKCDNNRQENSAEHSWHIALTAVTLQEYADEVIDISRVIQMLLIHDVVEIDAGDTFAFASDAALNNQEEIERNAAYRIFGLLPEPQSKIMLDLWMEFENAETADSRFAKAIDRILPLIQNVQNEGGSWAKHKVNKSKVLARNQYLKDSAPTLWEYACQQIDYAEKQGWLI